jgi:hypothetical protein
MLDPIEFEAEVVSNADELAAADGATAPACSSRPPDVYAFIYDRGDGKPTKPLLTDGMNWSGRTPIDKVPCWFGAPSDWHSELQLKQANADLRKQCDRAADLAEKAVKGCEQLRQMRDKALDLVGKFEKRWRKGCRQIVALEEQLGEANARAEQTESERDEAVAGAEKALARVDAKLRELRAWVAEKAPDWMAQRAEIDRLLANPPGAEEAPDPSEPDPEPRASSALLQAAKYVLASYRLKAPSDLEAGIDNLGAVIEDEAARGPSEVEKLRKERDDAIKAADGHADEVEELRAQVAQTDSKIAAMELHGNSVQHWYDKAQAYKLVVRELRMERDEAIARAETFMAELEQEKAITATLERDIAACHDKSRMRLNRAEKAEASAKKAEAELRVEKQSRLAMVSNYRAAVAERDSAEARLMELLAEEAPEWMAVRAEIDRLLANPPSAEAARGPSDAEVEGCDVETLRAALFQRNNDVLRIATDRDLLRNERDAALAELAACFGEGIAAGGAPNLPVVPQKRKR